jgi:hypothetical protein
LFIFFSLSVQGQWKLKLDGLVKDEATTKPIENANIDILIGGTSLKSSQTGYSGSFLFEIDPNQELVIRCSKAGYVAKMITLSTSNVNDPTADGYRFFMDIRLFKEMPDLDVSVLNQPIGAIFYSPKEKNFDYTVDKVLKRRLEQLQEEVDRKIKQQVKQAKKEQLDAEDKAAKELADRKKQEEMAAKELEKRKQAENNTIKELTKGTQSKPFIASRKTEREEQEYRRKADLEEEREKIRKANLERKDQDARAKAEADEKKKSERAERLKQWNSHKDSVTVQNLRQDTIEGVNYMMLRTRVLLNGKQTEFRRVAYNWGGIYCKHEQIDISDVSYNQLMRMIVPELREKK